MQKFLWVLALIFLAFPAHAQPLGGVLSSSPQGNLRGTATIDGAGTLNGAKHHCFVLPLTTPDGDIVADTSIYRVMVRRAFTVQSVYAYIHVAGTTSAVTIDINEAGSTLLSTKLSVDAGENDSTAAATPAVISDSALAANSVLSVDVDSADSGNTAAGGEVQVCGYYN
jgi:hypothetical protein